VVNNVYVSNRHDATVSVIDEGTATVIATIPVGNRPEGVGITPDNAYVYVANVNDGTVSVIQTSSNTVIATVTVGSSPTDVKVAPNGVTAYVTNLGSGNITPITVSTNTAGTPIGLPSGAQPNAITILHDGSYAYITDNALGVDYLNLSTLLSASITLTAPGPIALDVTPNNLFVYVTCGTGGTVPVIATASNTVIADISTGITGQPQSVSCTPDGTAAWVSSSNGSVFVISTASNTVIRTVTVASGDVLEGIAITPDGTTAFVCDFSGGDVAPIDVATFTPGAIVNVGVNPWGICLSPATSTEQIVMIV
jgi:YVTN family beta-propeller protein